MKRTLLMLLAMLCLTGCTTEQKEENLPEQKEQNLPVLNEIYRTDDIADGYHLLENVVSVYPYDNRIYAAAGDSVGYYNTKNMQYTSLASVPAEQIIVNEDELIVRAGEKISVLDLTGTVTAEWSIPEIEEEDMRIRMSASDQYVVIELYERTEDQSCNISMITLSREDGSVKVHPLTGERVPYILMGMRPVSEKEFIIASSYYYLRNTTLQNGVFRYSAETGTLTYLYDFEGTDAAEYVDGKVYSTVLSRSILQLTEISADGEQTQILRSIGHDKIYDSIGQVLPDNTKKLYCEALFYTGSDFLIWDSEKHVLAVFDAHPSADGRSLNILYPADEVSSTVLNRSMVCDVEYSVMKFEEQTECSVNVQRYPVSEFADRLRMKLLAGDADMDVIHMDKCDEGDLLQSILRYGLYLPLENHTPILENYQSFADGVEEFMTYDGHLIGIPYRFGGTGFLVTSLYLDTGLPIPSSDWTIEDFWDLCEQAIPYCDNDIALCDDPSGWIMRAIIQNGISAGRMNREAVLDAVNKIYQYEKQGLFGSFLDSKTALLDPRAPVPPQSNSYYADWLSGETVLNPTIDGKRYLPIQSLVFAYKNTDVPDLALDYLTMLSGEEFAPKMDDYKTYFMKDSESYFTVKWNDHSSWVKKEEIPKGSNGYYAKVISDILPGTSMLTLDQPSAGETISGIFKQLYDGKITPEAAADKVISYANYRYFE